MIEKRPVSRPDLLAELADDVNQLTRPRRHVEKFTRTVHHEQAATGRRRKSKRRTQERRAHTVTLPSLLESLAQAMVPGAADQTGGGGGSFESRPPAELEPVAVLREITTDVHRYARALGVDRTSLVERLRGLVSAQMDDGQLRDVARSADRWVTRARQATGFDPMPITIGDPCIECGKRNALVVSGDMEHVTCARCGSVWTHDTFAQLAEQIKINQTQEVASDVRCWWRHCTRRGVHDDHEDQDTGRRWRDWCDVPANNERNTA